MDVDESVKYLLRVRNDLRSTRGVTDPIFISENMQRLAQYTGRVEEILAELEEDQDELENKAFHAHLSQGKSVNMAETLAKKEVGNHRGKIARLSRLVKSSWALIGTAQSRRKHLETDFKLGGKIT